MSLTAWDQLSDPFNHTQLFNNWAAIDVHDHSSGKGVKISSTGLATGSVGSAQLAANAVTSSAIAANAVTTAAIANNAVGFNQLARGAGGFSYSSVSGNTTAQNGFFYNVSAVATITLPSPATNATVGVRSGTTSIVTITTPSGTIGGPGIPSPGASIQLGTQNAVVQLLADGTNWWIIGGQFDTGWINLTLQNSYTSVQNPAARQIGTTVWLRGTVQLPGLSSTSDQLFALIPAGVGMPSTFCRFSINETIPSSDNMFANIVTIDASGNLTIRGVPGAPSNYDIPLNGIAYQVN